MNYNISLRYCINEVIDFLNYQINELSSVENTKDISNLPKEIAPKVSKYIECTDLILDIKSGSEYITNSFSNLKNEESINAAKERVLWCLKELNDYIYEDKTKFIDYRVDMDEYTS